MGEISKEEFVHGPGGTLIEGLIALFIFIAGEYLLLSVLNLLMQNKAFAKERLDIMASGKEKCISLGVLSKHVFIETFFYFIGMFVGTCMFPDHMIFVLLGQIGLIVILNLLSKDRILGYNKKM